MFGLLPPLKSQYFDDNGNPLTNGKLYSFIAGSTTPVDTYTDASGSTTNTNPIVLDARGEADVWLSDQVVYKFVLEDANGVEIYSVDNVRITSGGGGSGGGGELVKVSVLDVMAGYLSDKIVGSGRINTAILNAGGIEQLQLQFDDTGLIDEAQNIGLGEGVFAQENGNTLEFKSLTISGRGSITSSADEINIEVLGTSAGITNRVYFTGDDDVVNPTWKQLSDTDKGTTPEFILSQGLTGDTDYEFPTKFISGEYGFAGTIKAGFYDSQLIFERSNNNGEFKIDATYDLVEADGTTLVQTLATLTSGTRSVEDDRKWAIPLSGFLPADVPHTATQRIRVTFKVFKIGGGGANNTTMEIFVGSDYESFIETPVDIFTSDVTDDRNGNNLNVTLNDIDSRGLQEITNVNPITDQDITIGKNLTLTDGVDLAVISLGGSSFNIANVLGGGILIEGSLGNVLRGGSSGPLQLGSDSDTILEMYFNTSKDRGSTYTNLKGMAQDVVTNEVVQYDIPVADLSGYVTIDTPQTITGAKTLDNILTMNGAPIDMDVSAFIQFKDALSAITGQIGATGVGVELSSLDQLVLTGGDRVYISTAGANDIEIEAGTNLDLSNVGNQTLLSPDVRVASIPDNGGVTTGKSMMVRDDVTGRFETADVPSGGGGNQDLQSVLTEGNVSTLDMFISGLYAEVRTQTETNLDLTPYRDKAGWYTTPSTGVSPLPSGWATNIRYIMYGGSSAFRSSQILIDYQNNRMAIRGRESSGGSYSTWSEVVIGPNITIEKATFTGVSVEPTIDGEVLFNDVVDQLFFHQEGESQRNFGIGSAVASETDCNLFQMGGFTTGDYSTLTNAPVIASGTGSCQIITFGGKNTFSTSSQLFFYKTDNRLFFRTKDGSGVGVGWNSWIELGANGGSSWVTPTYATGWIVPNGPGGDPLLQELQYQDDGTEVNLTGCVQRNGGGLTPNDTLIFTLPVGLRPTKQMQYFCSTGNFGQQNGNTLIDVKTNGDVTITNTNFLNNDEYVRIELKVIL